MITINDLKEFNKITKKEFKFNQVGFRYHNKNKTGGNFAINYAFSEFGKDDYKDYELNGEYRTDGSFIYLEVGKAFKIGTRLDLSIIENLSDLLREFKKVIEDLK
jgi:hypothetical protein